MKYFVYTTNCSNHNYMKEFNNIDDALKYCKSASIHNTCILIKGEKIDWKKVKIKY